MAEFIFVAVLMALGMGAYWSFILLPRQREFTKRQNMARSLVEGDEVITAGGIVGKVMRIESDKGVAYVELADGLQVRVVIAAMLDRYDPEELAKNARMARQESAEPAS
ncbi:MAG: preprotein translocase subunit YajC [Chloroflexota bacterium]